MCMKTDFLKEPFGGVAKSNRRILDTWLFYTESHLLRKPLRFILDIAWSRPRSTSCSDSWLDKIQVTPVVQEHWVMWRLNLGAGTRS